MLIDTHCHLDAREFTEDRGSVIERAGEKDVGVIVIPSVARFNLDTVRELAHSFKGGRYALGIHPLFVPDAQDSDLAELETQIQQSLDDPRFVAIGEIGLDYFVSALKTPEMREKQETYYSAQLDLAQRYGLPVLLHVRRSQDMVLKHLRRRPPIGGIAHAFNGSFQQAQQFIEIGFVLGFGGAMTYARALQIRRLVTQLPMESLVLETDAPDIPPAWLSLPGDATPRNEPAEVAGIAQIMAELRNTDVKDIILASATNARRVLPRLAGGSS